MNGQPVVTETEPFVAVMRGSILCVRWRQGATIDDAMAAAFIERAAQISPNSSPPMLVELNGMVTLTRGALLRLATNPNVGAMASVGPSVVDYILSQFFTQVYDPPYPTRHFTNTSDARAWLLNHSRSA
ncbi:hypothetical protein D6T65_15180 [Arthrobacter frigidicola]|nr:hypothetical protein D6T65_15180 [Arthrobacter frigidicola]